MLSLGIPLVLFGQALTSCGSDGDGESQVVLTACPGPGMCEGTQQCNNDGTGCTPCTCDAASGGTAGSAGAGGSAGAPSGGGGAAGAGMGNPGDPLFPAADRVIGAPCNTDADCPTGPNGEAPLICISPTSAAEFGTGSPQGGYCTAPCTNTDGCQTLDGLSACGLIDDTTGSGYCIGLCVPGAESNVKCFPERAQACFAFPDSADIGACFPVCQSDAACGAGQFCDLGATGLGLCVTAAPVGGDIGAPCTAATAAADCKSGLCVELADGTGAAVAAFCSANCTFGLIEGCGFDAQATVREAVCAQSQLDGGGPGDLGFCFELCDTAADCAQAGYECVQNLTPEGQMLVGRLGQCLPPDMAAPPPAAGDAGAP